MTAAPVRVVLAAGAAEGGPPSGAAEGGPARDRLAPLLGPDRRRQLEHLLLGRATAWAAAVAAPEPVHILQGGAAGLRERVISLFAAGEGPVLAAWPKLPVWHPDHAAGALADLADGCDVSLGPMFDGGFYLVAFSRPVGSLLGLDDAAWNGPDPIDVAARAAAEDGLSLGLLRTERGLRRPEDVRALLADPLLDDELRGLLS